MDWKKIHLWYPSLYLCALPWADTILQTRPRRYDLEGVDDPKCWLNGINVREPNVSEYRSIEHVTAKSGSNVSVHGVQNFRQRQSGLLTGYSRIANKGPR